MFRNKSVNVHQFAMIPRADIPRSSFDIEFMHKTTFDAGLLIPFYVDEVLPGDTFRFTATMFARMATPIFPVMDNMYLESFFFYCPSRLVWTNFVKMMGQQDNPGDSVSFIVPQLVSPAGGWPIGDLGDYFGLPTVGQVTAGQTVSVNALPFRAYNLIYNEWFRDENLVNSKVVSKTDGPDALANYALYQRGKRRDYFTSALPFVQKGQAVPLPLGSIAPVKTLAAAATDISIYSDPGGGYFKLDAANPFVKRAATVGVGADALYTDLASATAATINQIREAFQIQRLLERDARGGTRYTELVTAHFGVRSPDARLDRPEYLGGGSTPVNVNPIAQQSATGLTGGTAPLGSLGAMATVLARNHGFSQSFVEHGYVIGLMCVRADLSYQQGLRKMWRRSTKYDFYWPVFANLGEQAIYNREIYCKGDATAADALVFGYQERWAEYRYNPSLITGKFRSTAAGTLDAWHLSQNFTALPTLNGVFISEAPPVARVIAVPSQPQFIFDSYCRIRAARPMPMYSVPGLVDHL